MIVGRMAIANDERAEVSIGISALRRLVAQLGGYATSFMSSAHPSAVNP